MPLRRLPLGRGTMMNRVLEVDSLIDYWVDYINRHPRTRVREDDVPVDLRHGPPMHGIYYDWRVERCKETPWITSIEAILQDPLPACYRSLVTRYAFPAFGFGPIFLLANTGQDLYNEMGSVLLRNQATCRALLDSGFIQIARPLTGEADPICFDFNHLDDIGEPRLVRIYQSSVLASGELDIAEVIAPSFQNLLEAHLQPKNWATGPIFSAAN